MSWWSAYVVPLSTPAAIPPQAAVYRRVRRLLPSSGGGVPLGTGTPKKWRKFVIYKHRQL